MQFSKSFQKHLKQRRIYEEGNAYDQDGSSGWDRPSPRKKGYGSPSMSPDMNRRQEVLHGLSQSFNLEYNPHWTSLPQSKVQSHLTAEKRRREQIEYKPPSSVASGSSDTEGEDIQSETDEGECSSQGQPSVPPPRADPLFDDDYDEEGEGGEERGQDVASEISGRRLAVPKRGRPKKGTGPTTYRTPAAQSMPLQRRTSVASDVGSDIHLPPIPIHNPTEPHHHHTHEGTGIEQFGAYNIIADAYERLGPSLPGAYCYLCEDPEDLAKLGDSGPVIQSLITKFERAFTIRGLVRQCEVLHKKYMTVLTEHNKQIEETAVPESEKPSLIMQEWGKRTIFDHYTAHNPNERVDALINMSYYNLMRAELSNNLVSVQTDPITQEQIKVPNETNIKLLIGVNSMISKLHSQEPPKNGSVIHPTGSNNQRGGGGILGSNAMGRTPSGSGFSSEMRLHIKPPTLF